MITIELKDAEVSAILNRLGAAMSDLTPVMQEIGEQLVFETEQRFAQGVSPGGAPWAPKSETTLEAYARRGDKIDFRPLFGPSGRLHSTIDYRAGSDFVEVGSGAVYAAVMQFGAGKGAFGVDAAGHPIPWGPIPARPFIGISEIDRANIIATVTVWIEGLAAGSDGA
ncbi:MAG: phage virion morphogenesis protein [Alphaproteobacteria bacterium HGW-Alphaproteobacteria-4]|jgi:phage virion morphogenesis protein|nr:MAG: phage virion morphogenesis protein [Alphaproteobacteria bacterium HGW-Alphaproteobacteria-4]